MPSSLCFTRAPLTLAFQLREENSGNETVWLPVCLKDKELVLSDSITVGTGASKWLKILVNRDMVFYFISSSVISNRLDINVAAIIARIMERVVKVASLLQQEPFVTINYTSGALRVRTYMAEHSMQLGLGTEKVIEIIELYPYERVISNNDDSEIVANIINSNVTKADSSAKNTRIDGVSILFITNNPHNASTARLHIKVEYDTYVRKVLYRNNDVEAKVVFAIGNILRGIGLTLETINIIQKQKMYVHVQIDVQKGRYRGFPLFRGRGGIMYHYKRLYYLASLVHEVLSIITL